MCYRRLFAGITTARATARVGSCLAFLRCRHDNLNPGNFQHEETKGDAYAYSTLCLMWPVMYHIVTNKGIP